MSTQDENLKNDPLPVMGDDNLLPSRIAAAEKEIAGVDAQIAELQEKREELTGNRKILIDHAVKTGHMEDPRFRIEVEIAYGNRVADPEKLAKQFPKEWSLYVMAVANHGIRKISGMIEKAKIEPGATVNLGIADKIFGEENVTACSVKPEVSRTYKVVKK